MLSCFESKSTYLGTVILAEASKQMCKFVLQEREAEVLQAQEPNVVEVEAVRKVPASKAARSRPGSRRALQENLQSPEY